MLSRYILYICYLFEWHFFLLLDRKETETGLILDDFLKKKKGCSPEEVHMLFSDNRWMKVFVLPLSM